LLKEKGVCVPWGDRDDRLLMHPRRVANCALKLMRESCECVRCMLCVQLLSCVCRVEVGAVVLVLECVIRPVVRPRGSVDVLGGVDR
jgi:hypothetical protein